MNGLQNLNGREGLLKTPLEKVDLPTGTQRGKVSEAKCKQESAIKPSTFYSN